MHPARQLAKQRPANLIRSIEQLTKAINFMRAHFGHDSCCVAVGCRIGSCDVELALESFQLAVESFQLSFEMFHLHDDLLSLVRIVDHDFGAPSRDGHGGL
ncbi:MAG TPA: hypothetical protein VKR27_05825 [Acidimicrobiales bacterium]|nr:hypothetical protein [Acidimicrobiales bacterium]